MKQPALPLIFAALLLAYVAASCSGKPDDVLPESELVSLMADLQLAEAYSDEISAGSDRRRLADGVLAAHGVSREQLDSTLAWYGRNLDDFNKLYAKVDKEIDSRRKKIVGSDNMAENADVDNLWPFDSPHLLFSNLGGADNLTFELPGDDFAKGDGFSWKMRLNKPAEFSIILGVDYADGSASYDMRSLSGNQRPEISIQTDTAKRVSRLYGIMRFRDMSSFPLWIDSVALVRRSLDTLSYYQINTQRLIVPLKAHEARKKEIRDSVSENRKGITDSVAAHGNPHNRNVGNAKGARR